MSNSIKVQQLFGQFAVLIDGEIKTFGTEAEALSNAIVEQRKEEFEAEAHAFAWYTGLEGKRAKTQENVIIAFLTWQAATTNQTETVLQDATAIGVAEVLIEGALSNGADIFDVE